MALIKCPECGQEVSDKAVQCPRCAYPIATNYSDGTVRIRLESIQYNAYTQRVTAKQRVTIYSGSRILWEGHSNEIAEFKVQGETNIRIEYHTNMSQFGASCEGRVDPSRGGKYVVKATHGMFKNSLALQRVDMFS